MTEETARRLREAIIRKRNRPFEEQWKEMVDRGVIDENGKVLLPSIAPRAWNAPNVSEDLPGR